MVPPVGAALALALQAYRALAAGASRLAAVLGLTSRNPKAAAPDIQAAITHGQEIAAVQNRLAAAPPSATVRQVLGNWEQPEPTSQSLIELNFPKRPTEWRTLRVFPMPEETLDQLRARIRQEAAAMGAKYPGAKVRVVIENQLLF